MEGTRDAVPRRQEAVMDRPFLVHRTAPVAFDDAIAVLSGDAGRILQAATDRARTHATSVRSSLHATVGGFEVARGATIDVGEVEHVELTRSRISLRWYASQGAILFPVTTATLDITALSLHPPRVQVALAGSYEPPLGWLGDAVDAALGHRVAASTVAHFVEDVVTRLTAAVAHDAEPAGSPA